MKLLCPLWGWTHTHTHFHTYLASHNPTHNITTTLFHPRITTHTASALSRHQALYSGFSSGRENMWTYPSVSITIRVGWSAEACHNGTHTQWYMAIHTTATTYTLTRSPPVRM